MLEPSSNEDDDLGRLFNPARVALVGATADTRKIGHSLFVNLLSSNVDVYPVTSNGEPILGVDSFKSLSELPKDVDVVIVAVPAAMCPALMPEVRSAGAKYAVVISGGFSETGKRGRELEAQLVQRAHEAGVRILGPNCVGIASSGVFNGTFTMTPPPGNIAVVSQSGALGGILIYTAKKKNIGLSRFVSIGNACDIGFEEVFLYLANDPITRVIVTYVESFKNGRASLRSLQEASSRKPVVVLKGGRTDVGQAAASSHTGSLSGSASLFDAMMTRVGCVSAPTLDSLLEIAKVFDYQPLPFGKRIGIISNTGGAGVLAADALVEHGLVVPVFCSDTQRDLSDLLPSIASVRNPVDLVATATGSDYMRVVTRLLDDPTVDVLLVICAVPTFAGMSTTEHAVGVVEGLRASVNSKPVAAVWLAGDPAVPGREILESARIPCYDDPYMAALCISKLVRYAELQKS
ncbi:MAG: CoA-binding protein [Candidatus Thorarchaeota archaeon]